MEWRGEVAQVNDSKNEGKADIFIGISIKRRTFARLSGTVQSRRDKRHKQAKCGTMKSQKERWDYCGGKMFIPPDGTHTLKSLDVGTYFTTFITSILIPIASL